MLFIIIAMLLYTAAILFGTAASRNADTNLAAAITNVVSVLIPVIVAAHVVSKKSFYEHKFGVLMAILGGVAIACFVLALNKSFSLNKVGVVTPIVFGGAIFLSTTLSYFIFREKISGLEALGLAFLAIGLVVIVYARATAR